MLCFRQLACITVALSDECTDWQWREDQEDDASCQYTVIEFNACVKYCKCWWAADAAVTRCSMFISVAWSCIGGIDCSSVLMCNNLTERQFTARSRRSLVTVCGHVVCYETVMSLT